MILRKPIRVGLCSNCMLRCHGMSLLKYTNPELVKIWDFTKNNDVNLNYLSTRSNYIADWVCSDIPEHKWSVEVGIISRKTAFSLCPYCNLIRSGGNADDVLKSRLLKDRYPKLKKEWDFSKNTDVDFNKITYGSSKKVWWTCSKNKTHHWQATIKSRAGRHRGCPYCKEFHNVSETDLVVNYYLNKYIAPTKKEFDIDGWKVDNFIESHQTIIEFDGSYYHNRRVEADLRKTKYLLSLGYKVIKIVGERSKVPKIEDPNLHYIWLKSYTDYYMKEMIEDLLKYLGKNVSVTYKQDLAEVKKYATVLKKEMSFGYLYPNFIKYWDFNRNVLTPYDVPPKGRKVFYFKCPDCGYCFVERLGHFTEVKSKNPNFCACCTKIKAHGNLLKFITNKNLALDKLAFRGHYNNNTTFKCPICHQDFEDTPNALYQRIHKCPHCHCTKDDLDTKFGTDMLSVLRGTVWEYDVNIGTKDDDIANK